MTRRKSGMQHLTDTPRRDLAEERSLSDALAEALRNYANLACFEVNPDPDGFTGQTRAALSRYDAAREAK